jgi:hypothetical protein
MRARLVGHRCRVFLHRIRFPGRPLFSSAAAKDLIGRRIIVGITYEDQAHRPLSREQYQGTISRLTLQEGIVILTASGAERTLPPDVLPIVSAPRGVYRFRSTGEVVADPELRVQWIRTSPSPSTPSGGQRP